MGSGIRYRNPFRDWGGYREGAGRPKIGTKRTVSITLPDEEWAAIDKMIENGKAQGFKMTVGEYFRGMHNRFKPKERE